MSGPFFPRFPSTRCYALVGAPSTKCEPSRIKCDTSTQGFLTPFVAGLIEGKVRLPLHVFGYRVRGGTYVQTNYDDHICEPFTKLEGTLGAYLIF